MNFDILRQKILEKAIRGELVPQLESEPEVRQIGEAPDDVPFSIPEKWKWCNFGNVVAYGKSKQVQPQNIEKSAWILDLEDIESGTGNLLQKKKSITAQSNKTRFRKGDVLYSKLRPYLNKVIVADDDGYCTTEIVPISPSVAQAPLDAQYLKIYLMSPYFVGYANQCSYGVKMPRLGTKDAQKALFPIPPIEEQRRIVAELNQLFEQIDRAEKAYNELSGPLSDRFRQLCLEKAIQGKLVPQLESEPVVNQIGDVPDNCPFRLPKKWKWVKLGAAFSLKAGKFISASEIKDSGAYPCYGGNGKRGYVDKFNREGRFPLIGRQGALCGNINLVDGKFYATEHAVVADGGNIIDPDCAAFFLKALNLNQYATKTAQPGLSVKRISKTPFPLAPIQEQKRIVKKIQDLLLEISSIKQS